MSTRELDGLGRLLNSLALTDSIADLTGTHILANPLDICRSLLALQLSSLVECDASDAYKSIQWPNNIFNGDLSVTLPRLKPGCKPAELSSELVNKV